MKKNLLTAVLMIFSFNFLGCAGNIKVKLDPNSPAYKLKNDFELDYGFFITPDEREKGYSIENYPKLVNPIKPFSLIDTTGEFNRFEKHFWDIRDTNPSTPENEFKDIIDQRIQDIKNEIFSGDIDIPLTRFDRNGGLKGDLAHVYLLYGTPHFKAKLSQGTYHVELMVWYYFDFQGKPIFKFLFYNNYGTVRLFRRHIMMASPENLFDPMISPLKEISNRFMNTPEELYEVWRELELQDPEWAFLGALLQFSYYSDVVIEGGGSKELGALDPPEPAALTAERFRPTVLGQPDDFTGREFIYSSYHSLIPAELIITKEDRPSFTLITGYADVDWEIKGDDAEFVLDLRISLQNKMTRKIKEFSVRLSSKKSRAEIELKRRNSVMMKVLLDDVQNFARPEEPRQILRQLVDSLEPGTYVVNVDLRHPVTKKSAGGWREEIIIR